MNYNILIIYPNSFPSGGAATNRVFHIAKAIQEGAANVNIIITRGTERKNNIVNSKVSGVFKEVPFFYATTTVIWPNSSIGRLFNLALGLLKTINLLYFNRKKIDIIISYADYSLINNFSFFMFCKLAKKKFVCCVDEHPWSVINGRNTFLNRIHIKYFYKLFDGFIVMTNILIDYYKTKCRSDAKFIHIPMTVEFERFEFGKKKTTEEYIAYCGGDKTGTKDGIDILIKAFNVIKDEHTALKLYIIGPVHKTIKLLVSELKLDRRVVFFGFINGDKVPDLLINAKILCLARPNNKQAEGGFPTKLGEYLASGVPIVVTNIGEIRKPSV